MAQVDSLGKTAVHLPIVQVQNIDKNTTNTVHGSSTNDLKGDSDPSSDIELLIEESDDKKTASENKDAINGRIGKKNSNNNLNANKDPESLKFLDDDLSNTADLVRTGFSADEFNDQIDCLDALDDSTNSQNFSNATLKSTDLNDPGKGSESTLGNNDTLLKSVDDTPEETVNCSDEKSSSTNPENQKLICPNRTEIERNNNTTGIIDKDEKPNDSPVRTQLSVLSESFFENTVMTVESEIVQPNVLKKQASKCVTPDTGDLVTQRSISAEADSPKIVEQSSIEVEEIPAQSTNDCSKESEEMSVDADSSSGIILIENKDKSDRNNTSVLQTTIEVPAEKDVSKQVEKMSIDSISTSDTLSVSISDVEKNTKNDDSKQVVKISVNSDTHSKVNSTDNTKKSNENCTSFAKKITKNDDLEQTKEMSKDDDSLSEVISTDDVNKSNENFTGIAEKVTENDGTKQVEEMLVDSSSQSRVPSDKNIYLSEENPIGVNNLVEKNTEDNESKPSNSKQKSIEKVQTLECRERNTSLNDDLSGNQIRKDQTGDPVNQIHSLMVLNNDKEPNSVDSTDIIIDSVESEIVELDAEDEPVILDDDDMDKRSFSQSSQNKFSQLFANTAKEIAHDDIVAEVVLGDDDLGISTLNSCMSSDNESRKRRLEQNETSRNDTAEKRARVSEAKTSDDCNENRNGILNQLFKKKTLVNKARKHTSSTNAADTVKEIEKKIHNDLLRQNRSQASSPGQDSMDEFDLEINDTDGDVMNDERDEEAAHRIDNNSVKIKMNYDVISKDNLKNIFQMMRTRLTRRQLEVIVIQKCCEMISDSNEIGTLRRQVADLQQAEMFRKQKILNLEKQISQLRAVCQRFLEQVQENSSRQATPIKITRSVGLQVSRDCSSYNFNTTIVAPKSQEKLKKLLSTPALNRKPVVVPETRHSVSRQRTSSPLSISINHRNNDLRLTNGNTRMSSPLGNSSSTTTSCSSPSIVSNSRSNKKIAPLTDANAPVIDLTDKDDKNENESDVAAKNLLSTVNGTYVAYVPANKNQDQSRQVIKPGTSILVNGQLMTIQGTVQNASKYSQLNVPHPAPVPPLPTAVMVPGAKPLPPKPLLKIDKSKAGIMLSWEFPPNYSCAEISKYQLYAYQETNLPARSDLWKAVGDVSALPLPMACTLTQFVEGYKYHFIVRAVDIHSRCGPFSAPRTITL